MFGFSHVLSPCHVDCIYSINLLETIFVLKFYTQTNVVTVGLVWQTSSVTTDIIDEYIIGEWVADRMETILNINENA